MANLNGEVNLHLSEICYVIPMHTWL